VGQLAQVVLEQVVAHAELDGVDGSRLADGAGQQDERRVLRDGLQGFPCIQGRETGQAVVGRSIERCCSMRTKSSRLSPHHLRETGTAQCLPHDVVI
jgi:hypothetical protein